MRVLEKRVLRRMFAPKRDEVAEEWRKLHNEELLICTHPIYFGGNQFERNDIRGTCSTYGKRSCV